MDINGTVEKLICKYNTSDPFRLCDDLGINIYYEELGRILGYSDNHYRIKSIHLNSSAPEELLPFICAHELGHSILHPHINTPFLASNTLFSVDKIELQANKFAVELLLPDSYLIDIDSINLYSVAHASGIPLELESLKFSCPIN